MAVGLALAVALAFLALGAGDELPRTLTSVWFYRKLVCMALVAVGAWLVLADLARPGLGRVRLVAMLPGAVAVALLAVSDTSGLAPSGRHANSVPICVGAIVLLALPSLALVLHVVRTREATMRPCRAGAVAGILAGALGAGAYALACSNDGYLFVALWYGMAVVITSGLGTVLGRRTLSW